MMIAGSTFRVASRRALGVAKISCQRNAASKTSSNFYSASSKASSYMMTTAGLSFALAATIASMDFSEEVCGSGIQWFRDRN